MFQRKKLSEDAHRKEKRAANAIRGGVGALGIAALIVRNKDKIVPAVKTVAQVAKAILFKG